MQVLLIDDDPTIGEFLALQLRAEGIAVDYEMDAATGIERARGGSYDALVLDVMMPQMDGIEALRRIRMFSRLPVILLTAKYGEIDRIIGLEVGADDYVQKPCSPRELIARLRAILRRSQGAETQPAAPASLHLGTLVLYPAFRRAEIAGTELDLTTAEFNLLELLVSANGRVLSKQELCEKALGSPFTVADRRVDVHISNLRQKVPLLVKGESCIRTVRGFGYQVISE